MEFAPFKIVVLAIVALAIIALAISLFLLPQRDFIGELNKNLTYAEQNLGKAHNTELLYPAGLGASSEESFDTHSRVVSFKCNKPFFCSAGQIDFDSRRIFIRNSFTATTSFRCVPSESLKVCTVYIGEVPAQLSLGEAGIDSKAEKLSIPVKNIGSEAAKNVRTTLRLYSKRLIGGELVEILHSEAAATIIESLAVNEEKEVLFSLSIAENGHYAARLTADGEDAGLDAKLLEFEVSDRPSLESCRATEKGKTTMLGERCQTKYMCEGCSYGFECSLKWREKEPEKGALFEIASKDYAIIESAPDPETGLCAEIPPWCSSVSQGDVELLNGKCVKKSNCENCETAQECFEKWATEGREIEAASAEYAYEVVGEPVDGSCRKDGGRESEGGMCLLPAELTMKDNIKAFPKCTPYFETLKFYWERNGLKELGIDLLLLQALIMTESSCNPQIDAQGLMQVVECSNTNLHPNGCSPQENIDLGTAYLARDYRKLLGEGLTQMDATRLLLFSYNRGQGTADRALAYYRSGYKLYDAMQKACLELFPFGYKGSVWYACKGYDREACCGMQGFYMKDRPSGEIVAHSGAGLGPNYPEKILNEFYAKKCTDIGGTMPA